MFRHRGYQLWLDYTFTGDSDNSQLTTFRHARQGHHLIEDIQSKGAYFNETIMHLFSVLRSSKLQTSLMYQLHNDRNIFQAT